jgi:uncharacterized membrane protein YidH (DUF202 family)
MANMAARRDDDRSRVLFYVGIGAAILFIVTITATVLVQSFAPLFGLSAGAPDPAIVGSMLVWAGTALGFIPAAAILARRKNDKDDEE